MMLHSHSKQMRSHLLLHPLPTTTATATTATTATATATATLFLASSSPSHSNSTNLLRFSRYRSASPPPPDALPRWDSNAEPIPSGRSTFGVEREVEEDYDDDDGGGFGPNGGRKQRVWWSGYDDEGEDLDFEVDEEFWGFKSRFGDKRTKETYPKRLWIINFWFLVLRAFGWMFPAIAISLLLGTGPNAFIMASAVPLGQTLLSLAFEKVWGETSKRESWKPRPRAKAKKKPFVNPRSEGRKSGGKQENGSANGGNAYQSWVTTDGSYSKAGSGSRPRFGGWDELDKKAGTREVPKSERSRKTYVPLKQSKKGKFSRIGRVREMPLLVRLLIAAFPFLGFWTKLLF